MWEPKLGDKVLIKESYCADAMYVGLSGEVVRVFKQTLGDFSVRIKVELPAKDKKFHLGDTPIFPAWCVEKIEEEKDKWHDESTKELEQKGAESEK